MADKEEVVISEDGKKVVITNEVEVPTFISKEDMLKRIAELKEANG